MSSILDHRAHGLEALTVDLHRRAAHAAAPGCTLAQVRDVLRRFGYQRYTRAETTLCLYWQLAEGHVDEWPCQPFLEQLTLRMLQTEEETTPVPRTHATQGSDHLHEEAL
jgi:hypothetical protein